MKKIGILTFHRSYNYGAFMQCYSLSKRIADDFPDSKVEVIDYCTSRMHENYPVSLIPFIIGPKDKRNSGKQIVKQIGKFVLNPAILSNKRKLYSGFDEDINALPLSSFRIVSDEYDDLFHMIDNEYDILVVGSDAVWEFITYPFPNAYYPNYDFKRTILMSYAASSGRMQSTQIDSETKLYIQKTIDRFRYIGVRDRATESFLHSISDDYILYHNCDPTAFLDLESIPKNLDRVKNELEHRGIDLSRPIIGLMGNNQLCNMLRQMFGNKYQIVAIYQHADRADCNLDYLTPFEWARIFSLFSVTVTKFFHGTMLSLKNGTPTIATDTWTDLNGKYTTKIGDLYHRLGLEEHYFYMNDIGYSSDELKNKIEFFINNPDSNSILSALKAESRGYQSFKESLNTIYDI